MRMALMEPPKGTDPVHPLYRNIADIGSMPNEKGSSKVRATTPPNPGNAPKTRPIMFPITIKNRFLAVKAWACF